MPPPCPMAVLSERVLLTTVSVPSFSMPAPTIALLPDTVLLVMISDPSLMMPPPILPEPLATVRPERMTEAPLAT